MKTTTAVSKSEPKKHNLFSASAASRWIACPGSISLSKVAPPQRENAYAKEGTQAHAILEAMLKGGSFTCEDEEMVRHCGEAANAIRDMVPVGAELLSETKCSLDFIHDDMGGTTDAVIIEPYGKLIVVDFKYGAVPVSPEQNEQMLCYALSIAHEQKFEFTSVELVIIQPRATNVDEVGAIKKWETTTQALKDFWSLIRGTAKIAESQHPFFSSGDHCKYCPGASVCSELRDKNLAAIQVEFDDETGSALVPMGGSLNPRANLGRMLDACDRIETWIGAVRDHAYQVLESGGQVPGYKLVAKRSIRKWASAIETEEIARKKFGAKAFTKPELLSPAQLEKIPGAKEFVAEYATAVSSGTTIAPESDPRPAANLFESKFKEGGNECTNAPVAAKSSHATRSYSRRSAKAVKPKSKSRNKKRKNKK